MPDNSSSFENLISRLKSEGEGKLDTDLGGMDSEAAGEYVLSFAATLKETQKAREACEGDKALWDQRVILAKSKNNEPLAAQAQAKADALSAKLTGLRQEEAELKRKVSFMKDELKRLKGKTQLSVDPDALLAQFEMVLGQPDTTSKKIKETEAGLELEKLKKKLEEEGK